MASDPATELSRRAFLRGAAAAVVAAPLVVAMAEWAAAAPPDWVGVDIRPRSDWAQGLPAPGPLESEQPGDVRFLLVHHSASSNGYAREEAPNVIRGFHAFHTGPDKGWPDVAYNFFVDRYGTVWEGRTGSLAGPVKPDATGGSQGFAQICCFVGDHSSEPPTAEARAAMTALLAALAHRYGIDPRPGATVTFVSRGSNKWPAGASVTTSTIAGHRDMSMTRCPGDGAYALVTGPLPVDVAAVMAARAVQSPVTTSAPPGPTTEPSGSQAPATSGRASSNEAGTVDGRAADADADGLDPATVGWLVGGAAVAAGTAYGAFGLSRGRGRHRAEQPANRAHQA